MQGPPASSLVFDGAMGGGDGEEGEGVERMETEELSLVLEESQVSLRGSLCIGRS